MAHIVSYKNDIGIRASRWEYSSIKLIPGAWWDEHHRVWVVPAILTSVKVLEQEVIFESITPKALESIEKIKSTPPETGKFPEDYKFKHSPYKHQINALNASWGKDGAREQFGFFMWMGCLSGDTVLKVSFKGKVRNRTIAQMHKRQENFGLEGVKCRSLKGDVFGQNEIIHVHKPGIKQCLHVVLEDGKQIECTYDHKLLTNDGWVEAQNLYIKQEIFVNGEEVTFTEHKHGKIIIDNKGRARVKCYTHPRRWKASGYIYYHTLVAERKLNRYLLPDEIVHHTDGDPLNNHPNNLEVMDKIRKPWGLVYSNDNIIKN